MKRTIVWTGLGSLSKHPRIVRLRQQVAALPINSDYRSSLYRSIDLYADQIIARPEYAPDEGLDDLEALQQVTLSNSVEREMQRLLQSLRMRPADEAHQNLPENIDHFTVMVTKDKVVGRGAFLKAIESLEQPGYELPVEMDEDVKAVILRTWKQLKERGLDASSLVNRQGKRDLLAKSSVSPEALAMLGSMSANTKMQPAVGVAETKVQPKAIDEHKNRRHLKSVPTPDRHRSTPGDLLSLFPRDESTSGILWSRSPVRPYLVVLSAAPYETTSTQKRRATAMPVIDRRGQPLPEGHPFKGTQIVFGQKRPDSSATPSADQPDPMRPAMDAAEAVLTQLISELPAKTPSK